MVQFCWWGSPLVILCIKMAVFGFHSWMMFFSVYRIPRLTNFSFSSLKMLFHCLLACMVSNESATIQIIVFLYIICLFSLDAISASSFSWFSNDVMCLGIGFFVSILLGVSLTFISANFSLSSNLENFGHYFSNAFLCACCVLSYPSFFFF